MYDFFQTTSRTKEGGGAWQLMKIDGGVCGGWGVGEGVGRGSRKDTDDA